MSAATLPSDHAHERLALAVALPPLALAWLVALGPSACLAWLCAAAGAAVAAAIVAAPVLWITSGRAREHHAVIREWWQMQGRAFDRWCESRDESHACYHLGLAVLSVARVGWVIGGRANKVFSEALWHCIRAVVVVVTSQVFRDVAGLLGAFALTAACCSALAGAGYLMWTVPGLALAVSIALAMSGAVYAACWYAPEIAAAGARLSEWTVVVLTYDPWECYPVMARHEDDEDDPEPTDEPEPEPEEAPEPTDEPEPEEGDDTIVTPPQPQHNPTLRLTDGDVLRLYRSMLTRRRDDRRTRTRARRKARKGVTR